MLRQKSLDSFLQYNQNPQPHSQNHLISNEKKSQKNLIKPMQIKSIYNKSQNNLVRHLTLNFKLLSSVKNYQKTPKYTKNCQKQIKNHCQLFQTRISFFRKSQKLFSNRFFLLRFVFVPRVFCLKNSSAKNFL